MRRVGHLLLCLGAGLAAGVAVLAVLVALRLERGPVAVDFLAPALAAALGSQDRSMEVAVDHASLGFEIGPKLELLADGVHFSQRPKGASLTLPDLAVDVSLTALFRGVIAPTRIVLTEPFLRLDRDRDGSFHLGFGSNEAGISEDWAQRLLRDLAVPSDPAGPLGALTDVEVRRARFIIDDHALGVVWRADDADVLLHRDGDGLRGEIRLAVAMAGNVARLDGVVSYRAKEARLSASLDFTGMRLAEWASAAPALAPLAAFDLPVSGTLRAVLDPARAAIVDASVDLVLGRGVLRHGWFEGGALAIAGGVAAASYDPAAGRIELRNLALDLGGPQIMLHGTLDGVGADLLSGALPPALDAALELETHAVPVDALPQLWPERLAPITRAWVVGHIHDGTVDRLTAQIAGRLDLAGDAPRPFSATQLAGTVAYRNISVDYFKPLPPARGIDGTAIFDRATLEFTPTSGALMGVRLKRGTIRLFQLDTNDEQIAIDLSLRGPLANAIGVLDHDPLHYAQALAIDPRRVAGDFDARVTFAFPLVHTLQLSQIDFGAQATLTGVAIGAVLFGRDLADGQLKLVLDRSALRLDGTAALAGVPVTLGWTHSLNTADAVRTRYTLQGRLDAAARHSLGLDFFPDMMSGTVGVALDYTVAPSRQAQAAVTLDLGAAQLAIARLGWSKPPGTPATARLALDLTDDRLVAVRQAVISGGGLEATLAAQFAADGDERLTRLDVRHLVVGKTDVGGSLVRRDAGGWRLQLSGASFDASALLEELQAAAPATAAEPPLVIDAKLDRLLLGGTRELRQLSGEASSDGLHWEAATIDAALPGGGVLRLRFGATAGDRSFHLTTDDFGGFLHLIDLTDAIEGGSFQMDGTVLDEGARRILKGRAQGRDYRLVGAPLLARLLSLASFSGIGALLRNEGIPFSRLDADLTYRGDEITADNFRAYGGAIGINAAGSVDKRNGTIDVSGTLVPAYLLNSVLGNIPLIGSLLMGGEGEGLFGANFRIAGPLDGPTLSVNPLSALAPGVLRKLFLFEPGNPASNPAPTGNTLSGP